MEVTLNPVSITSPNLTIPEQLQKIVLQYLEARPNITVNALSKKCQVSEPTLRRIVAGKVKTIPQISTLLSILTYISGKDKVREIAAHFSGPLAEHLQNSIPSLDVIDHQFSNEINRELKNPVSYLIFKLALNNQGVSKEKIEKLFGLHGVSLMDQLIEKEILYKNSRGMISTKVDSYRSSNEDFVRNFKLMADYIKPAKLALKDPLNPYFLNKSDSINGKTYAKIRKLVRANQAKIDKLVSDPNSRGTIPFFLISALDTLDHLSAREVEDQESSQ